MKLPQKSLAKGRGEVVLDLLQNAVGRLPVRDAENVICGLRGLKGRGEVVNIFEAVDLPPEISQLRMKTDVRGATISIY
jgi:hypothetical protein